MSNLLKIFKLCIPIVLICSGFAVLSLSIGQNMYQGLPEEDQILYRFINGQGKILGKKYGMRQCGNGLEGREKTSVMALSFERFGETLTEEEARKLIVQCSDDFLEAVNHNEELKPLLRDYPFTAKNLHLTIFNCDKNQDLHRFPAIGIVSNSEGEIAFLTKAPSAKYGYHTEKYEAYEEAVAILKSEH